MENSDVTISVIIPNYNSRGRLRDTIDSIIRQTEAVDEIIVIDDHSDAEEQAWLSSLCDYDGRLIVITLLENSGSPSLPRNIGIEAASGDYIAFVDSGDIWLVEKVARQMPYMRAGYPAICSNYAVQKRGHSKQVLVASPAVISFALQSTRNFVGSPTGVIKRHLSPRYKDIGHEDYLYWMEVSKQFVVRNIGGDAMAIHFRDPNSRSSHLFKNILSIHQVFKVTGMRFVMLRTLLYTAFGILRRIKVATGLWR